MNTPVFFVDRMRLLGPSELLCVGLDRAITKNRYNVKPRDCFASCVVAKGDRRDTCICMYHRYAIRRAYQK